MAQTVMKRCNMNTKIKKISIIGAGNLATQLSLRLFNKGFQIEEIYARKKHAALELAKQIKAKTVSEIHLLSKNIDLLILAVSDDAIPLVAKQLQNFPALVVHCSGSVPLTSLSTVGNNIGVFYPLQSFSKDFMVDFSQVPFFIEGKTPNYVLDLSTLASAIGASVQELSSEKRQQMHLTAVFANNFTNHLFTITEDLCKQNGVDFSVLQPLLYETLRKAELFGPQSAQTGPAKRNDQAVMSKHLRMLHGHDLYQKIYTFVSESIYETHRTKHNETD